MTSKDQTKTNKSKVKIPKSVMIIIQIIKKTEISDTLNMPQEKMTPLTGQLIKVQAEVINYIIKCKGKLHLAYMYTRELMKTSGAASDAKRMQESASTKMFRKATVSKQKFHDYHQAMKDAKTFMPEHKQNETMNLMSEKRNMLDQNSVWLVHFFNMDPPSRDDTDTNKFKNILWLGCGKRLDMADELIINVVEKWEKSKDNTSFHTALDDINKQLFNFLKDIYQLQSIYSHYKLVEFRLEMLTSAYPDTYTDSHVEHAQQCRPLGNRYYKSKSTLSSTDC
ncbi:hypothetical protein BDR05DRAFT_950980 [Suillus weaverae]|nr:hypothetical protein BDR05DRAFT_950980 [Suillus weaverae]